MLASKGKRSKNWVNNAWYSRSMVKNCKYWVKPICISKSIEIYSNIFKLHQKFEQRYFINIIFQFLKKMYAFHFIGYLSCYILVLFVNIWKILIIFRKILEVLFDIVVQKLKLNFFWKITRFVFFKIIIPRMYVIIYIFFFLKKFHRSRCELHKKWSTYESV